MKTKFLSLLLVIALAISLAACTSNKMPSNDDSPKDEQQTTASDTTEAQTEPESKLAINDDLIADIGLTYPQLVEKHGKRTMDTITFDEGSAGIKLENGYGSYMWGFTGFGENETSFFNAHDENGNIAPEDLPDPRADIPCTCIRNISVKDLFVNASFPMSNKTVKDIDGTDKYSAGSADGGPCGSPDDYHTSVMYKQVWVSIIHSDPDIIDESATAYVYVYD